MNHISITTRILNFIEEFRGKLSSELLDFSIDYVTHGENLLALETVCDYLCEEDVVLRGDQYLDLMEITAALKGNLQSARFVYLARLMGTENP